MAAPAKHERPAPTYDDLIALPIDWLADLLISSIMRVSDTVLNPSMYSLEASMAARLRG